MQEYKGIPYIVFQNPTLGFFCGYIRIPDTHSWQAIVDYNDIPLEVHGGVTFADRITKDDDRFKGQPFTSGYWVGWDYAHLGDAMPDGGFSFPGEKIWTAKEVEAECKNAIRQLLKAA